MIIHCSECSNILCKNAKFPEGVELQIKCFHCKKFVQIKATKEISVEVKCIKLLLVLLIPVYLYIATQAYDPVGRVVREMRKLFIEYAQN